MSRPVRFNSRAEFELLDAADHYGTISITLAVAFLDEVDRVCNNAVENPKASPLVGRGDTLRELFEEAYNLAEEWLSESFWASVRDKLKIFRRYVSGIYEVAIGRNPVLFDPASFTEPDGGSHGRILARNLVTKKIEAVGFYTSQSKIPGAVDRWFESLCDFKGFNDNANLKSLLAKTKVREKQKTKSIV